MPPIRDHNEEQYNIEMNQDAEKIQIKTGNLKISS